MEMKNEQGVNRRRAVWFGLIAAVVLLAGFAIGKSARMSRSMSAAAASAEEQPMQNAPGTKTKFVLEISETTAEGTIRGKLLLKKTEQILHTNGYGSDGAFEC